jgi:hypothetical protein
MAARAGTVAAVMSILGAVAAGGLAGCGGAQAQADRERQTFECNDRMAGYVAHGTLGAEELGVAIDCAERGPRIVRWRVDPDGTRAEDARGMTPGQFDALWRKVDQSGWRDLQDCASASDKDPVYSFTFRDWSAQNAFECQALDPPFPYHTIRDELDRAARQGRRQLGPDVVAPDEVPGAGAGAGSPEPDR